MMKTEELTALGLTTEQATQTLAINGKDIEKHKALEAQEKERADALTAQLADRDKDIAALKAADADGLKAKLDELQGKYTTETEAFKAKLADRDYADAVSRTLTEKSIKFSSKAAEKAYVADLKARKLALKDGAIFGFDDFHKEQLTADPTAFVSDTKPPVFSGKVGEGAPPAHESLGTSMARVFNAKYAPAEKKE